jgi:hypothetical protein
MSKFDSIQITSSTIPVKAEVQNTEFNIQDSNFSNNQISQKRTIFSISIEDIKNFRSENLIYNPQVYRWYNLNGLPELRQFEFQVYAFDAFGNFYLIQLPPSETSSIKFLFQKNNN